MPRVIIELFGVPRLRTGVASLTIDAANVGDSLRRLLESYPTLDSIILHDGQLHPAYRLGLNGEFSPLPLDHPLNENDALLLLAADAGG